MSSRGHYLRKYRAIFYAAPGHLLRGFNIPAEHLTPEQLALRRVLKSLMARIQAKDEDRLRRLRENTRKPLT